MDHGFPNTEVVEHVYHHAPDLAAFLGDQNRSGAITNIVLCKDSVNWQNYHKY